MPPRRPGPSRAWSPCWGSRSPPASRASASCDVHEWVEHTSEVELRVSAPTAEEVVGDATAALGELLGEPGEEPATHALEVEAGDAAGLLAAWLEELVFLAEQDGLVPEGARDVALEPMRLKGVVV